MAKLLKLKLVIRKEGQSFSVVRYLTKERL